MRQLSWKPVRRGKLYCAPACGRGCTKAEYDATMKMGRRLAKRLGRDWKLGISENLGWYCRVVDKTGCLKVHPDRDLGKMSYTAFLGEDAFGGRWTGTASSPEKAIRIARRQASKELSSLKRLVLAIAGVKP